MQPPKDFASGSANDGVSIRQADFKVCCQLRHVALQCTRVPGLRVEKSSEQENKHTQKYAKDSR